MRYNAYRPQDTFNFGRAGTSQNEPKSRACVKTHSICIIIFLHSATDIRKSTHTSSTYFVHACLTTRRPPSDRNNHTRRALPGSSTSGAEPLKYAVPPGVPPRYVARHARRPPCSPWASTRSTLVQARRPLCDLPSPSSVVRLPFPTSNFVRLPKQR